MKVLVACEFSGKVRDAFRKNGHDAWSCDLEPSTDNSPFHIQGDVLSELIYGDGNYHWDLMIAFPPCTYLTVTATAMCSSGFETQKLKYRANDDNRTNVEERTNTAIAYSRC